VVGSVLVGGLLIEGGLRVARAVGGGSDGAGAKTTRARYLRYDPLLGWSKIPGARTTFHQPEYTTEVAINSCGLRDPERAYAVAPGALRLLALGDSFIEGYSVPLDQTVTQVLEASLRGRGLRAEILNGGTSGYSTDQEYLFYRSEGARYAPRVVVLFFYYNDVLYNSFDSSSGAPKPRLAAGKDGRLEPRRFPVPKPPERSDDDDAAEADSGARGSLLFAWLHDRLWSGAPRTYNSLARLGLWRPRPKLGARLELRVYEKKTIPKLEDAWEQTALILGALARDVSSDGGRFLVAYVPSRMEVDEAAWDVSRFVYEMDETAWDRRQVAARLKQIGRVGGFPVLDLTPALRAASGWLGGPYFAEDGHWNALGHRTAAREVEGFLSGQGWLN
jgi:hypothetical protein